MSTLKLKAQSILDEKNNETVLFTYISPGFAAVIHVKAIMEYA